MKLIGQFDSPFTRRIGIVMRSYGLDFEHLPWSVFSDADKLAAVNPLIRVPTLVLETGEALIETSAIIDYLDSLVAPAQRLTPQTNPARFQCNRIVGLASGLSDMAVRLFYEQRLHDVPSAAYVSRITRQMSGTLQVLDNERAQNAAAHWFGPGMTLADVAVTCMFRHLGECHPTVAGKGKYSGLEQHCAHFEALPVFSDISQAFIPPA
jgi:glutathione S-transferase